VQQQAAAAAMVETAVARLRRRTKLVLSRLMGFTLIPFWLFVLLRRGMIIIKSWSCAARERREERLHDDEGTTFSLVAVIDMEQAATLSLPRWSPYTLNAVRLHISVTAVVCVCLDRNISTALLRDVLGCRNFPLNHFYRDQSSESQDKQTATGLANGARSHTPRVRN
jgi:hypothetical protein